MVAIVEHKLNTSPGALLGATKQLDVTVAAFVERGVPKDKIDIFVASKIVPRSPIDLRDDQIVIRVVPLVAQGLPVRLITLPEN